MPGNLGFSFEICLKWKLFIKEAEIILVADLF